MTPARQAHLVPLSRPVPQQPPAYDHVRGRIAPGPRFELYSLLDNLFIAAGVVVSIWLALLYLVEGFSLTPIRLLYLLGFWLLLTYITLPRLHQLMTWIYLPDYFFGRTRTTEGVLSDPINLAFDGAERDLHVAMRRAGWVLAEERTLSSAWSMVRSTLLRRSYPAAPVSNLYLMGRRHDFTYQQEVGGTTTKRHHVRFWRMSPDFVLPGGYRSDWLAAGTYDRAVGFSFFTLQITHRIDENIDAERDFVIDTVRYADPQVEIEVIRDFSTSYHHRNGQGDRIRTDGDLPVLDLEGASVRSDGATAMMLARHRPTGTSVMKSRARAALAVARRNVVSASPADVADELTTHWQDTVDDFHQVIARAADHHLPPPTVIFTGVLVLLQAALVVVQWIARFSGVDLTALVPDAALVLPSDEEMLGATAFVAVLFLLQVGVLRRSRWSRIALMALFTIDAFAALAVATSMSGEVSHSLLVGAGASALGVMAVSSDASRQWIQTLRLDLRSAESDAAADAEPVVEGGTETSADRGAEPAAGVNPEPPRDEGAEPAAHREDPAHHQVP